MQVANLILEKWVARGRNLRNLAAEAGVMRMHFLVSLHGSDDMPEAALRAIRAHFSSLPGAPVAKLPKPVQDSALKNVEVKKISVDFGISVVHTDDGDVPGAGKWRLSILEQSPEQLQGVWIALHRRMRPSLLVVASEACP